MDGLNRDLLEIFSCTGIVSHMIGLAQSLVLSKCYDKLETMLDLDKIYGFTNIVVVTEDREKYLLGTLYSVDHYGYKIYDSIDLDNKQYTRISDKVFMVKKKDLGKYLKKHGEKIFSKRKKDLEKLGAKCWGRKKHVCILSSGDELTYSLTYLLLSMKCGDESIQITALEFFDKIVYVVREPISIMLDKLVRKKKLSNKIYDDLMDEIDQRILVFFSELIGRHKLVLPTIKDVRDLVNYVKSHYKW